MIVVASTFFAFSTAFAQLGPNNVKTMQPDEEFENIRVEKINSDERVATYVMWIKKEIKHQKHEENTENIYVLEGEADITLGEATYKIKEGDHVFIPDHLPHSIKVTSEKPLKLLSVRAPDFTGTERVYLEEKE